MKSAPIEARPHWSGRSALGLSPAEAVLNSLPHSVIVVGPDGEIHDAKTIIGLLLTERHLAST